jgi:hypothetical protein
MLARRCKEREGRMTEPYNNKTTIPIIPEIVCNYCAKTVEEYQMKQGI